MRQVRGSRSGKVRAVRGGRKPQPKPVAPHRAPRRRTVTPAPGLWARTGDAITQRLAIRRPGLLLALTLIVLVLIAGLVLSGVARRTGEKIDQVASIVSNYAGFGISKPAVTGENRTPEKLILDVLNLQPGQSIFAADLGAARARLLHLPWVAEARVTRRYPNAISVIIAEKQPFALWQSAKGLFVIDRSGAPIVPADEKDFPKLPVFAGDQPLGGADLVAAIGSHRAVVARVAAMQRVSGRRWNLILDSGVLVKLPEADWEKQIDVLERLIVDKGILERDIQEIDLRAPDRFIFRLTGQKQPQPIPRESKV